MYNELPLPYEIFIKLMIAPFEMAYYVGTAIYDLVKQIANFIVGSLS